MTKEDVRVAMWDVELPVEGCCPECGEDLSTTVRIRSTAAWIVRYHTEERLYRSINHAVAQQVLDRHGQRCDTLQRQQARFAASA